MNAPDRMAVVITKLFGRLQGIYGTSFTSKFSTGVNAKTGIDDGWENAKSVWAEDLAGYVDRLEIIAAALKHVDPDRPPTSRQFLQLCNDQAKHAELRQPQKALPYVPTAEDRERAKAMASQAAKAISGKADDFDPLLWAKRPNSQKAMDMVIDGSKRSTALAQIVADHVANGVCTAAGKLLKRYKGQGQWVSA